MSTTTPIPVLGTLNQDQQILVGCVIGGIVLLAIIIGVLVYKCCWPFKDKVKRTTRIIKRHHYLEEKYPEKNQDIIEYVESIPPEPVSAPIQYVEAPMQAVQAPMLIEQPVQMVQAQPQIVQERVIQEPVQMIQQPSEIMYEQPMSYVQMPQQRRQIVDAPMVYEQAPAQMQWQTNEILQAPTMYEQPTAYVQQAQFPQRGYQSQMMTVPTGYSTMDSYYPGTRVVGIEEIRDNNDDGHRPYR